MVRLRWFGLAATLAVATALAGCSGHDKAPTCPRLSILPGADSLTRFRPGPGRDILDIEYEVQITDVLGGCKRTQSNGQAVTEVTVAPVFVVSRGAATEGDSVTFPYFVSVVRDQQVLQKQEFLAKARFAENRSHVAVQDSDPPILVNIPASSASPPGSVQVILGMQLTPDELSYNRRTQTPANR